MANLEGSVISSANLSNTLCVNTRFNGADLTCTSVLGTTLSKASFEDLERVVDGSVHRKPTNLRGLKFDKRTKFREVKVRGVDWTATPALQEAVQSQNECEVTVDQRSLWKKLLEMLEAKPGWFGMSIDLRSLFRLLRRR